MSGNFFDKFIDVQLPPIAINGHDEPPLPVGEHDYGQVNEKTGGKPLVEIIPPEFADDALALNFSEAYGQYLSYVKAWGRWYIWDGMVWKHDETLKVLDLCRRTCRSYAVNAPPSVQKSITSAKTIMAVERLAQSDRRHAAAVDQWDLDHWLLNTPAGVVDLRTGDILPHDPKYHMTKITAVAPGGDCPTWHAFLMQITQEDGALIDYLQRMMGYALTGSIREHALFFAYGTGGNGKGTFIGVTSRAMGEYAITADTDTFTQAGTGKHLTTLARLHNARLVTAQETESGVAWAEARIKSLTGGDPIAANYMRQDLFTFRPQFKLLISGNHRPPIRSVDRAMRRRFNLIPFTVDIPMDQMDKDLDQKLDAEMPGILAWMIEWARLWNNNGLNPPQVVVSSTQEYLDNEDTIEQWTGACCEKHGSERSEALYKSWKGWAAANGEDTKSNKAFSQELEKRGYLKIRSNGGMQFRGLRLTVAASFSETEAERF